MSPKNYIANLEGDVYLDPEYAKGTKSAHKAVMLRTDRGSFKLRRQGGNAFVDPELTKLVGKRITCDGLLFESQGVLMMFGWKVLPENTIQ